MIFVPCGVPHTFINKCAYLEFVGFFDRSNPLPEISLRVGTAFFPRDLANDALSSWGNKSSNKEWLKGLHPFLKTPYILPIES
jgi:hypothetical protein